MHLKNQIIKAIVSHLVTLIIGAVFGGAVGCVNEGNISTFIGLPPAGDSSITNSTAQIER